MRAIKTTVVALACLIAMSAPTVPRAFATGSGQPSGFVCAPSQNGGYNNKKCKTKKKAKRQYELVEEANCGGNFKAKCIVTSDEVALHVELPHESFSITCAKSKGTTGFLDEGGRGRVTDTLVTL